MKRNCETPKTFVLGLNQEEPLRVLPLATDSQGNIEALGINECWEALRRLALRNMDPTSSDFESLTWVQHYALAMVLRQKGIALGRVQMPGQLEDNDA